MSILTVKTKDKTIEIPFSETPVLSTVLERAGLYLDSPCGGKGRCGKCAVEVWGEISSPSEAELHHGKRLACKTRLLGDATVLLSDYYMKSLVVESSVDDFKAACGSFKYGMALDIGTTTLALKLFSGDGRAVAEAVGINPQRAVAADVIGRIEASIKGKSQLLCEQITRAIKKLVSEVCEKAMIDASQIEKAVITANTAMLYLLCGINPKSISVAPFAADNLFDVHINCPIKAYLPPCIDAFVGADLVCAVMASGMVDRDETALLCDVGTNGEIALWKNGRLYVTSAAAGPAFEGAEISCGCPCVDGAVDAVWIDNGSLAVHTVNNMPAVGICGSGLIDSVAAFLDLGYIDTDGTSPNELNLPVMGSNVYITKEDIRALQLAKSAMRSALEALLKATSTTVEEIKRFYLSGGFGNSINLDSAVRIGLIPKELQPLAVHIGNGALKGAAKMLFNFGFAEKAREIASIAKHIELGGNEYFNKLFVENLMF